MKTLEIKKALKNCSLNDIHSKIAAFTALERTDLNFLNKKLRSVSKYHYSQGIKEVFLLTYESTINNNPMEEGIQFVENPEFFYGLPIESVELFAKDSYEYESVDSYGVEFMEFQTNWFPIDETAVLKGEKEPCYYDMALINGKFWTFAPNLTEIREIAFQA